MVDLLDHDPVLRLPDRLRGARHGAVGAADAALLAVVLRGAAFGLRGSPDGERRSDVRLGRLFGIASVAAPLLFGSIAGGLAQLDAHGTGRPMPCRRPVTGAFALVVAVLALALCTQLAASFLTVRLDRLGLGDADEYPGGGRCSREPQCSSSAASR